MGRDEFENQCVQHSTTDSYGRSLSLSLCVCLCLCVCVCVCVHVRLTMTARMRCRVCVSNTYTSLSFSVQAAREKETIERLASKTHKDKVNEFNEKLANLTEHHEFAQIWTCLVSSRQVDMDIGHGHGHGWPTPIFPDTHLQLSSLNFLTTTPNFLENFPES